jgi:hypothetical protein
MQGNNISIIYCDEIGHAEIKKIPFEQLNEYFL